MKRASNLTYILNLISCQNEKNFKKFQTFFSENRICPIHNHFQKLSKMAEMEEHYNNARCCIKAAIHVLFNIYVPKKWMFLTSFCDPIIENSFFLIIRLQAVGFLPFRCICSLSIVYNLFCIRSCTGKDIFGSNWSRH